jgi:hypothetical protein
MVGNAKGQMLATPALPISVYAARTTELIKDSIA